MQYTLDKLVVYLRVSAKAIDGIVSYWNSGGCEMGDVLKFWLGHHPAVCKHNYTLQTETGESWYMGVGKYGKANSEFWEDVKLEFNPAKVGASRWFGSLYDKLISEAKYVDFKRFDVAVDIPLARSKLRLLKDQRRYSLLEYSAENKTEYLGVRSSHGQVKLYNKALEQKTEGNWTRLEITLDYDLATWDEFRRLWPKCQVLGSGAPPGKLKDTDLVLYLACSERPEYLKMLGRDKRKKIEQLLATTAQYIEPCEESYKSILAQILYYGKDIRPEMWSDFIEVSDADEDVWIPKKFVPLTGTQEQL